MEKEIQQIAELLGLDKYATPAQIHAKIGQLQERAENKNVPIMPFYHLPENTPQVHYHNGSPCYNNPCVYCGN